MFFTRNIEDVFFETPLIDFMENIVMLILLLWLLLTTKYYNSGQIVLITYMIFMKLY